MVRSNVFNMNHNHSRLSP